MKICQANQWHKKPRSDPFHHPKLEASYAGVDRGKLLHVSEWDDVLEHLRGVVAAGVLVKVGGSYLGARVAGHSGDESLIIGFGMLPRAGVELVVIAGALTSRIIDQRLFSAVLALIIVSVLSTPPLLKHAIQRINS